MSEIDYIPTTKIDIFFSTCAIECICDITLTEIKVGYYE